MSLSICHIILRLLKGVLEKLYQYTNNLIAVFRDVKNLVSKISCSYCKSQVTHTFEKLADVVYRHVVNY